jgi:hypothetical protein
MAIVPKKQSHGGFNLFGSDPQLLAANSIKHAGERKPRSLQRGFLFSMGISILICE